MGVCVVRDGSPEECSSGLGSPGEPSLAPVAWSVSGKFLAAAMEKVVNIWQVNSESSLIDIKVLKLFVCECEVLASQFEFKEFLLLNLSLFRLL